jgi:predicted aspartyl protease
MKKTLISARYPYIPLTVVVNKRSETIEALLDTGFDGDIILPEGLLTNGKPPDSYLRFTLADQAAHVLAPAYLGKVEIAAAWRRRHKCRHHWCGRQ